MGTKAQHNSSDAAAPAAAGATHSNANTNARVTTTTTTVTTTTVTPTQKLEKQQQEEKWKTLTSDEPTQDPVQQVLIIPATQASTLATNAAKKIRRAFSMPRNPFRWSRKFKTSTGNGNSTNAGSEGGDASSTAMSSCVGGGRGRSGSIVSLTSYDENNSGDRATTIPITNSTNSTGSNNNNTNSKRSATGNARVLRRSSFRKFLNRIAQHLSTTVNVGSPGERPTFIEIVPFYTGCWRRKETNKHGSGSGHNGIVGGAAGAAAAAAAERVPPIGGYQWPADQTPGVMGLKNHGNTCFMNAVLQCLSHTDILAEYFVLDQYKADLKRRNKINSRKFGTKGELTEQLANVLKALWTCRNESDHSTSFKAVVDRYGTQFRSSTQHDAQEFLFWLLDKVHEDLNTASKRRYKSIKNSYGRSDEIIAAETLANHIRCNNSFVQAVFQAQFRSSLTCPRCKKQSNTFDPFHCISVQLPQLAQQTIFVTVVHSSGNKQQPRQVRMGLRVPAGSPIVALREQLELDTGIAATRMVLLDLNVDGFTRVFYDSQPVETLANIETIYCIEVPVKQQQQTETVTSTTTTATTTTTTKSPNEPPPVGTKGAAVINSASTTTNNNTTATTTTTAAAASANGADLLLLIANVQKTSKETEKKDEEKEEAKDKDKGTGDEIKWKRFGAPFSMRAPRDCSYADLQKRMLREMAPMLKPEVFAYTTPLEDMFRVRLQDPSADPDTYLEQVEHPLLTEMIDMALSVLSTEAGPPHVKLLLEWNDPAVHFTEQQLGDTAIDSIVVEHESVARLSASKGNDTAALTLEQCLEHYTKAETLSAEDAWRCPHCQQYLPVVKTLGLWSLPDILVVHFKRFRQHQAKGPQAAKLTTMVKFPLNAFDMTPHLAPGVNPSSSTNCTSAITSLDNNRSNLWKKARTGDSRSSTLNSRCETKDTRYDLYAVCYHQGDTLETGHYTAACKNPYDRHWYKFDDQRVSKVPENAVEEDIINNEAYMLFYQRRSVDAGECSGSSSNSGDHWVSRIAPPAAAAAVTPKEKEPLREEATSAVSADQKDISELTTPNVAEKVPVSLPITGSDSIAEVTQSDEKTLTTTNAVVVSEVTVEPTKPRELLIEELAFADADADASEREDNVNSKETEEDDKTNEVIAKIESNVEIIEDSTQIFAMDEDKLDEDEELEPNETIESTTQVATSCPVVETSKTNGHAAGSPTSTTASISSSSASSLSSRSSPRSLSTSVHAASTLQSKFNGHGPMINGSASGSGKAKSYTNGTGAHHELQLSRHALHNWHGSRSSVSAVENMQQHAAASAAASLSLRHSFSTSSNYKLRECTETLSSLLRNSANTCSKDTLLFIDPQNHHHPSNLIEDDDDTYMGRSLWISPVTPHKLITVSPKN